MKILIFANSPRTFNGFGEFKSRKLDRALRVCSTRKIFFHSAENNFSPALLMKELDLLCVAIVSLLGSEPVPDKASGELCKNDHSTRPLQKCVKFNFRKALVKRQNYFQAKTKSKAKATWNGRVGGVGRRSTQCHRKYILHPRNWKSMRNGERIDDERWWEINGRLCLLIVGAVWRAADSCHSSYCKVHRHCTNNVRYRHVSTGAC